MAYSERTGAAENRESRSAPWRERTNLPCGIPRKPQFKFGG